MELAPVNLNPATCLFCQRTPDNGEFFVDTKSKIRRGPVRDHAYVCPQCAGQIAAAAGWVDPTEHAAALDDEARMSDLVVSLEAQLEEARSDALAWVEKVVADAKPAPKPRARRVEGPSARSEA